MQIIPSMPPSISFSFVLTSRSSLTALITINPSDTSNPLHERLLLGGMAFHFILIKHRVPPFMYFDSRLSLSLLERRVVRSIVQATGTLNHSHNPTALMTSLQGDDSPDKNIRNYGGGFFRIPFW